MFSVSGSLTANGTNFLNTGGGSYMTFASTATLSGGTNTFNLTINVPYNLVPSLAGNTSFDEVAIENGSISSGTLALNLLGTDTSTFYYEFPSGFTVAAGGTMTVGANVPPVVLSGSTLTDAGTVTFSAGNQLSMSSSVFSVSGSLTANGTNFLNTGGGSYMVVNSGGDLVASGSTFSLQQLNLASGSTENLQYVAFDTQLAINSGASTNITSDDFTNGTVVASGSSNATISLINNFWGTTNPTQIAAKITDNANNPNLPNVTYEPFLSEEPIATYATIMWNTTAAPTGGEWDTPGNWVGGVIPTASDNAVIDLTSSGDSNAYDGYERRRPEPVDKRKHHIEHRKRLDRALAMAARHWEVPSP